MRLGFGHARDHESRQSCWTGPVASGTRQTSRPPRSVNAHIWLTISAPALSMKVCCSQREGSTTSSKPRLMKELPALPQQVAVEPCLCSGEYSRASDHEWGSFVKSSGSKI